MTRAAIATMCCALAVQAASARQAALAPVVLERSTLHFGGVLRQGGALFSPGQTIFLERGDGAGTPRWTIQGVPPWLSVTPTGGDAPARLTLQVRPEAAAQGPRQESADLTVTGEGRTLSSLLLHVTLALNTQSAPPVGSFDQPKGSFVVGKDPVELIGWAIDDIGVREVAICTGLVGVPVTTDCERGASQIGRAELIFDERPDVTAGFPGAPMGYRPAWSYVIDPAALPADEQTVQLYVVARDVDDHAAVIGKRLVKFAPQPRPSTSGGLALPALLSLCAVAVVVTFQMLVRRARPDAAPEPETAEPAVSRLELGCLSIILAAFAALTIPWLSAGLDYDELYTASQFVAGVPLSRVVTTMPVFNNHIGYSVLANLAVRLFGSAEWVVRLPAMLFGMVGVYFLWRVARRVAGPLVACVSAALLALSPFYLAWSRDARGYTGLAALAVLSTEALIRISRRPSRAWTWTHAVASVAMVYVHLYGVFVLAVQAIFAAAGIVRDANSRETARRMAMSFAAIAAGVAICYLPVVNQLAAVTTGRGRVFQARFPLTVWQSLTGTEALWLGAGLLVIAIAGLASARRTVALYAVALLVVPLATMWLGLQPIDLYPRFFLFWMPPLAYLLAAGAVALYTRHWIAGVAAGVILAAALWAWVPQDLEPPAGNYRASLEPAIAHRNRRTLTLGGDAGMFDYYTNAAAEELHSWRHFARALHAEGPVQVVYHDMPWNAAVEKQMAARLTRLCKSESRPPVVTFSCGQ